MIDREVTRFGAQREEASKIRLIFTYHHCSVQSHLCMVCVLCVLCVVCCVLCVVCCVLCVVRARVLYAETSTDARNAS
jgi:hypothetical protein